jgi:hypothetical protein
MTPGKFLRLLWPEGTGKFFCIAHPFKPEGSSVTTYYHKVFATVSEAVTHVHHMTHTADVFFAILTLEQEQVWNPEKDNFKTGQKGAWSQRTAENMHLSKALFFDLDVGDEAAKYPTQRDALAGLQDFITKTKLPMATQISSGGGVHAYWHFDQAIERDEWRLMAWHLRQLAEALGLKFDPTRTIDATSVLRVPETFNWKDRQNPRPVTALREGAVTTVATLKQIISDAMVANGVTPTDAPGGRTSAPQIPHDLGTQGFNDFGPPPTLEELGDACAQVREIIKSQLKPDHPFYGPLDNTAWYRGMLATLKHVEGGRALCHKLTDLHPRTVSDTEAKLDQLEPFPPARCKTLQDFMPWKDAPCHGCKFFNDPSVPNPLAAARKHTPAPPPGASDPAPPPPPPPGSSMARLIPPGNALRAAMIPNPPKPYTRLKSGGIALTRKDKDDNDIEVVIYQNDLYPLRRLVNKSEQKEQQVWRVTLPRVGGQEFVIDSDTLYDMRKFCLALSNNGIYPNKADLPALQDYMVAYISQLQKEIDADTQATHLGWAENYHQFILPDKVLLSDGGVRPATLSVGAERAAQFVRKAGDMQEQVRLLGFYNDPAYVQNQYVILQSFASIIFDMTGHHGIVVNCSGEAGASKSTTLYTAAGIWGDPVMLPINGTAGGATPKARMQRIATNANLPTLVDEITHLLPRDANDLVMGITQPGHRIRLTTDGVERKADDGYKSAIMIATANSSLHSALSVDNAAGTAGSMRVFEIKFRAQRVHSKAEADEYLRQLKLHYGHVGEVFAQFVIRNRAAIAHRVHQVMVDVDTAARITSGERFWSADIAVTCVTAEICQALGILQFDPAAIMTWALEQQVPFMRGTVSEEYRDPLAVLTDYIAEKQSNIAVVEQSTSIGTNVAGQAAVGSTAFVINHINGALLGHYDMNAGVLHLLKNGFKDYCSKIGASSTRIIEELCTPRLVAGGAPSRIVVNRSSRRVLGAKTPLAKGQTWCFTVDMNHPEMSGAVNLQTLQGGSQTVTPAAGNLQAVK